MFAAGNEAKRLSSINHATKIIYHHHHHHKSVVIRNGGFSIVIIFYDPRILFSHQIASCLPYESIQLFLSKLPLLNFSTFVFRRSRVL